MLPTSLPLVAFFPGLPRCTAYSRFARCLAAQLIYLAYWITTHVHTLPALGCVNVGGEEKRSPEFLLSPGLNLIWGLSLLGPISVSLCALQCSVSFRSENLPLFLLSDLSVSFYFLLFYAVFLSIFLDVEVKDGQECQFLLHEYKRQHQDRVLVLTNTGLRLKYEGNHPV